MSAVTTAWFVVLINGIPTEYFQGNRGLRQGRPLSLYLFILVVEGLRLLIQHAKRQPYFQGLKVARGMSITHLLFVDDVIVIGGDSAGEWKFMHSIVELFCNAFGLEVNCRKSFILHSCKDQSNLSAIREFFPFNASYFDEGLRYLGFILKPNGYGPKDWVWLEKSINRKITS